MNAPDITFTIAYLSGLASFLSPCLIPLLPSYFSVITGFTLKDLYGVKFKDIRWRVFLSTIFFVSGFSLVYSLMGATGTVIGKFLTHYTNLLVRISGLFLIVLGLIQLGVIKFKGLEFDYAWNVQKKLTKLSYINALITGILMAIIWIPCVSQILGAMFLLASQKETAGQGLQLLFIFSLGLGTPFVLLSLFFPWVFPFIQNHRSLLHKFNLLAGGLLVAFGILLVINQYGYYLELLSYLMPAR